MFKIRWTQTFPHLSHGRVVKNDITQHIKPQSHSRGTEGHTISTLITTGQMGACIKETARHTRTNGSAREAVRVDIEGSCRVNVIVVMSV